MPKAYPRRKVDGSRVAMFEDVIQSGGPGAVPPIEVINDGAGGYTIVEGVHRSIALRNLGYEAVDTVTLDLPGGLTPRQAAFQRAVETASATSKPLDRENERCDRTSSRHRPGSSDREVAAFRSSRSSGLDVAEAVSTARWNAACRGVSHRASRV